MHVLQLTGEIHQKTKVVKTLKAIGLRQQGVHIARYHISLQKYNFLKHLPQMGAKIPHDNGIIMRNSVIYS